MADDDEDIDLLDRKVFDPLAEDTPDTPGLVRDFRWLVKNDYQQAETLWAGGVMAVLLFLSQQLVHWYKHEIFDAAPRGPF